MLQAYIYLHILQQAYIKEHGKAYGSVRALKERVQDSLERDTLRAVAFSKNFDTRTSIHRSKTTYEVSKNTLFATQRMIFFYS